MDSPVVDQTVDRILDQMRPFFTRMVTQMAMSRSPEAMAGSERAWREGAQQQIAAAFALALEVAADSGDGGRQCPHCHARRRHKGRRARKLLTSVGHVAVEGVCWQCEHCGRHEHATQRLGLEEVTTQPMRELICLLGISEGSFAHAELAMEKLLGAKLSAPTIASVCQEQGRRLEAAPPPPKRLVSGTLVGSCDGMMVNTREDGWRELRAWRFDDHLGRRDSGAAMEDAATFTPRLRKRALDQYADQVRCFAFVSDAALWIKQAVAEHLPEVGQHVVDIYHAYQHIHQAAREIYGEGTDRAHAWAKRWCDELFLHGGKVVGERLAHARFAKTEQQRALDQLRGFLSRHVDQMEYPDYRRRNLPISSGPMESTCKQLGRRLKGPGMRWRGDNLTPMAQLISLWNDQRWEDYWSTQAA